MPLSLWVPLLWPALLGWRSKPIGASQGEAALVGCSRGQLRILVLCISEEVSGGFSCLKPRFGLSALRQRGK